MPNRFSHLDCHPVLPFWSSYAYKRSASFVEMRRNTIGGSVCVKLIIFKCHTFDKLWQHTRTNERWYGDFLFIKAWFLVSRLWGCITDEKVIRGSHWVWQDHGADLNGLLIRNRVYSVEKQKRENVFQCHSVALVSKLSYTLSTLSASAQDWMETFTKDSLFNTQRELHNKIHFQVNIANFTVMEMLSTVLEKITWLQQVFLKTLQVSSCPRKQILLLASFWFFCTQRMETW